METGLEMQSENFGGDLHRKDFGENLSVSGREFSSAAATVVNGG